MYINLLLIKYIQIRYIIIFYFLFGNLIYIKNIYFIIIIIDNIFNFELFFSLHLCFYCYIYLHLFLKNHNCLAH